MKKIFQITKNPTFVLYSLITALLIFIVCLNPPIDADMWWHLKSGQTMWQQKVILTQDQFSFTKLNQPWVNAFWLSDLIMYFLVSFSGLPFLIIFIALIGCITFLTIFFRSSGPLFIRSFVILIAAISVSPGWTARPQVFSFFLLAMLNLWMEKRKHYRKPPLFLLPLFFVAWVNIHGGFIWGFLLLIATIFGMVFDLINCNDDERLNLKIKIKQLAIWTSISLIAIVINPYGFSIWKLPFYTIDVSINVIQEWFSPNFHNLEMQPFLWIVFLLLIGLSLSEKKQRFVDIFKSVGFIYMGFVSQRNIPLSAIVLAPFIIDLFSDAWSKRNKKVSSETEIQSSRSQAIRGSGIINATLIFLMVIVAGGRIYLQTSNSIIENSYPFHAVRWVRENHPIGNMFNSYNWGGYLVYNLPMYPVYIDGRADLYGERLIKEWWEIVEGKKNAITLLDSYNINFLLIEPGWPIIDVLLSDANWEIAYQDDISIILIRR